MRALLILTFIFSVACQAGTTKSEDDKYRELLIGKWRGKYVSDDGIITYSEKTYRQDGASDGFISYQRPIKYGLYLEFERVTFISYWDIKDGIVIISGVKYSDGQKENLIRDKIISINDKEAKFLDLEDETVFVRRRIE